MTSRIVVRRMFFALLAAAALAPAPEAFAQQKVGAATAVNPDTNGTPPGGIARRVVIGQEVVHNEQVATGGSGQTQILFLDQSSLTIGPNAELTVDDFVFDPSTSAGRLAMSTTQGVLRYVGGALSKHENAVTLRTPSGTLGIRGGVFLLSLGANGRVDAVLLYGIGLSVTPTCQGCVPQLITHPGFWVNIAGPGSPASSPAPAPAGLVAGLYNVLGGQGNTTAGSNHPPTDAGFANSGLPGTLSGNTGGSDQAALNTLPPFTPPPNFNPATIQTQLGLTSAFSQGHVTTVTQQPPPPPPRGGP